MTEEQRGAMDDLHRSAWDVGYSFGLEGTPTPVMLLQVGSQVGGDMPVWLAKKLIEGHTAGLGERYNRMIESDRVVVRIAGEELPF